MSINLNDNIKINAGKPLDFKYLNINNLPYNSITEVNNNIPKSYRYNGLTVNINNIEYWYYNGVNDNNLIEKKYNTLISNNDYITGATNVGYYNGYDSIQILPINHLTNINAIGEYESTYHNFYRDINGIIRIGVSSDNIGKRAYIKYDLPVKSWVWNEHINQITGEKIGWLLIDGNINDKISEYVDRDYPLYYNNNTSYPYTNIEWIENNSYNNPNSIIVINSVINNLNNGNIIKIGARTFKEKDDNIIKFRSIISDTPESINIFDDNDSLIHISGTTINAKNYDINKIGVYYCKSNNDLIFKNIDSGNGINIIDDDTRIIINSTNGINTCYDLSSPTTINVGGIIDNTVITGMTTFEILENILSPLKYPEITNPSVNLNMVINDIPNEGPFEIGRTLSSVCLISNFNSGCINPKYNALSDKRSNGVKGYNYTGPNINSYYLSINDTDIRNISDYTVTEGNQTWRVYSCYCSGVQPYNSRNGIYLSPLTCGNTLNSEVTIKGILPWYWGSSESQIINGTCISTCGYNGNGGKCVSEILNDTKIMINYNNSDNTYIWFALPQSTRTMTNWYINDGNYGNIGGINDLFKQYCSVLVNSFEGYWDTQYYDLYVSSYKTNIINNNIMCIY